MISNYKILENGVIKQEKIINKNVDYNVDYVNSRYNSYGEKGLQMSYLRLGYILGVIGKIPNSILDVGYGNSDFLKVCKSIISKCYGNDISNYPLEEGVEFVEDITENHFDVITFFDSLEHFYDIEFVKNLKCEYVCISLPWCHNFSDEWFLNWKHRREDEHIFHFNEKSLEEFMKTMGFELVSFSNVEDTIRKPEFNYQNILTSVFKKKKI